MVAGLISLSSGTISYGPLFDLNGRVVGINSQIYSRSGGYQGLAFAIPIDVAMEVASQIINDGSVARGYLGVRVGEVDNDLAEALSMEKPYGALITDVEKGESGDDAGLQAGDVIIEFNGKEIKFGSDLPHVVGRIQPKTKANANDIKHSISWAGNSTIDRKTCSESETS